jgi:hypothetical protein
MAKLNIQPNARVHQIFDDLDQYREFCVEYGYIFDEATLYDTKNYIYRTFTKKLAGKEVKNMWDEDTPDVAVKI